MSLGTTCDHAGSPHLFLGLLAFRSKGSARAKTATPLLHRSDNCGTYRLLPISIDPSHTQEVTIQWLRQARADGSGQMRTLNGCAPTVASPSFD